MKKSILRLTLVAVAVSGPFSATDVKAQAVKPAKDDNRPHKVGLIDMAYIFKKYDKFKDLREGLKSEIEQSDKKAKAMLAEIQGLKQKLEDPTYKADSPQKKQLRKQYIEATTNMQAFRSDEQQRFLQKEAQVYKQVYMEVASTVSVYAKHYKYTLVLRWSRDSVDKATDPKEILGGMNRLVIFQDGQDITEAILGYLNDRYAKGNAGR